MAMIIINDENAHEHIDATVNGDKMSKGLIPRDFSKYPVGFYRAAPAWDFFDMPLIPRSEWSARIKEGNETKSFLSHIRRIGSEGKPIPSLDQNGKGYCWAHSATHAVMMLRASMGLPYVRLSAYAIACVIKNYQDEGGWGAQALDFIATGIDKNGKHYEGVPSVDNWPEKSMKSSNDNPATWENAALHKVTEGFVDIQAAQYDRDLTFDQTMTCLLSRIPVIGDFNWWSHSICLLDPVEIEPGSFGVKILNSWSDQWGDLGEAVLQGNKAIPDGATAPRVALANAA
jgi:hypothetical protein